MQSKSRRIIIVVLVLAFVVLTPFIIIYSLGYNLNFEQKNLQNSFSIQVDTLPYAASVTANNKFISGTPANLQTSSQNYIYLNVSKENYWSENFELKGSNNDNSSTRLINLWLLPKKPIVSKDLSNTAKKYTLIGQNLISFDLSTKQYLINSLSPDLSLINSQNISNLNLSELKSNFQKIDNFCYFNSQASQGLLNFPNNKYLIDWTKPIASPVPTSFPFAKVNSQVCVSNNLVWVLDDKNQLWQFNTQTQTISFLDNEIEALTFDSSTKSIWLKKQDTLFQLPQGGDLNIQSPNNKYLSNLSLINSSGALTKVTSLFQGISLLNGTELIVIYDKDKSIQHISSNAKAMFSYDNIIFWLDTQNNLFAWNFTLKQNILISRLDLGIKDTQTLFYDNDSKRLMLYNQNTKGKFDLYSFWYNKEISNNNIVTYSKIKWFEDINGLIPSTSDKYQFVYQNDRLEVYKLDNLL